MRITLILFLILGCTDIDGIKKKNEDNKKANIFFLLLAQNRTSGNCLRRETATSLAYCDRRPRGTCNANDLILTSSEKMYNINEGNDLVKAIPSCAFSFLNSGISSEVVQTFADQDTILANNSHSVVSSCEATGITSTSSLVTESELVFANSPRGRIAVAADRIINTPDALLTSTLPVGASTAQLKSDAQSCLNGGFPQSEKDLVSDLRTQKRAKAITCNTKAGVTNSCPF